MFDFKTIGVELKSRLSSYVPLPDIRGAGRVLRAGDGVVHLSGLHGCRLGELIEFEEGGYAIVMLSLIHISEPTRRS